MRRRKSGLALSRQAVRAAAAAALAVDIQYWHHRGRLAVAALELYDLVCEYDGAFYLDSTVAIQLRQARAEYQVRKGGRP